jgi:hypothetical protein
MPRWRRSRDRGLVPADFVAKVGDPGVEDDGEAVGRRVKIGTERTCRQRSVAIRYDLLGADMIELK